MKILFLIGNGFDKNLGLPTSYFEFYDYYLNKRRDNLDENIIRLHNDIKSNKGNWSDLELALGKYLANVYDVNVANLLHKSLKFSLLEYLSNITKGISFNIGEKNKFIEDLISPEKYLLNSDENAIKEYKSLSQYNSLSIITFNYDYLLESIFQFEQLPLKMDKYNTLNRLVHIHGTLEDGMILGVDNEDQIGNVSLLTDSMIRNKYLKPSYCKICRDNRDIICRELILEADLFFLYGLSLGDTDKRWWQLIVDRLMNSNKKLVLFWFDNDLCFSSQEVAERYEEKQRIKRLFLRHSFLDDELIQDISDNIIVKFVSEVDNEFLKVKLEQSK